MVQTRRQSGDHRMCGRATAQLSAVTWTAAADSVMELRRGCSLDSMLVITLHHIALLPVWCFNQNPVPAACMATVDHPAALPPQPGPGLVWLREHNPETALAMQDMVKVPFLYVFVCAVC
jgi:hypothetical protein